MKKTTSLILIMLAITTLSSCKSSIEETTVLVTDMVGDVVEVPKNPGKVAVVARAAADLLVAFGLGNRVDGMYYAILDNTWTSYLYPESSSYYRYEYEESYENFYAREVDLIFAPEKYIADDLRDHGLIAITVSQYGNPNFDDYIFAIADLIIQIWDDDDLDDRVNAWKNEFNEVKNQITESLEDVPDNQESIYYVRGDKDRGINYTDQGSSLQETFANYLKLEYAGRNFSSSKPTAEEVLAQNPDHIIIGGIYQNRLLDVINNQEPWSHMDAVTNNHVYNIGIGFVMFEQTSVEQTIFLASLANNIYPELFDFDIETMLFDTIQTYFGKTLTSDEIDYMLHGLDQNGNSMITA